MELRSTPFQGVWGLHAKLEFIICINASGTKLAASRTFFLFLVQQLVG